MPMSPSELSKHLETLRTKGSQSIQAIDNTFVETLTWLEDLRDSITSGEINDNSILIPQTPNAALRRKGRQLPSIEEDGSHSQENPSTSGSGIVSITHASRSGLRKRSRATKYYENEDTEDESSQPSTESAVKKASNTSAKSSKRSRKPEETKDESPSPNIPETSEEKIGANGTDVKDAQTLRKQSAEVNLNDTKGVPVKSLQADNDSPHVFAAPLPFKRGKKKGIRSSKKSEKAKECDSTSVSPLDSSPGEQSISFSKESIGANSTYVKEDQKPKKSTVGNRTYSKESIGANSTYVVGKLSMPGNASDEEEQNPKERASGNRTYAKESIGANSTYVVGKLSMARNAPDVCTPDGAKTVDAIDQRTSLQEASRLAVEEAMNGPARLTRTKAKAVAKHAAQAAHNQLSTDECNTQKSGGSVKRRSIGLKSQCSKKSNEMKLAIKVARKSLTRAKQIAVGKIVPSASTIAKGPFYMKPAQFYKVGVPNHVRSVSQSENRSPKVLIDSGIKYQDRKRTVSQTDHRGQGKSKELNIGNSKQIAVDEHKVREDRLQELSSKILNVCKKKDEMLKKQTEEKAKERQKKRERVLSARDEKEREIAMMRLIQENEQREQQRFKEAENKKKMDQRAKQELLMKEKGSKELHLQRLAQEGASYLAKPLSERAALPHSSKSKVFPAEKPSNSNYAYAVNSYDLTLDPENRQPLPSKDADNYGLDDVNSGDSSDDESAPKKVVPQWAQDYARKSLLSLQNEIPREPVRIFFGSKKCTPDLTKIFHGIDQRLLSRRSSAVWHSP